MFLYCKPGHVEQTVDETVICDTITLMWRYSKDKTAKQDSPNDKFKHAVYSPKTKTFHLQMITSMYSIFPMKYIKYKQHIAVKFTIFVALIHPRVMNSDTARPHMVHSSICLYAIFIFVESSSFYYHDFVYYH